MKKMTKTELMMLFRDSTRKLRTAMGLSQRQVAARMKTTSGYVCDMEHGRRNQNVATMANICNALEVCPAQLVPPPGFEGPLYLMTHDDTFAQAVLHEYRKRLRELRISSKCYVPILPEELAKIAS